MDAKLIPKEIREKFSFQYKFLSKPPDQDPLDYCARALHKNPDSALVVLIETGLEGQFKGLCLPTAILSADEKRMNLEFNKLLTFWIKRVNAISKIFEPMGQRKALLLPFQNFKDSKAAELWSSIESNLCESQYPVQNDIEKLVAHLKSREFPKKKGKYPQKYFVDDNEIHFRYGPEKHSKVETEGGNHSVHCLINSRLRMGLPYDFELHFNMSLDGDKDLKGTQLLDCHGGTYVANTCQHINMFPNSYIN